MGVGALMPAGPATQGAGCIFLMQRVVCDVLLHQGYKW